MLLFYLLNCVVAKNLILTVRNHVHSLVNLDAFMEEHNVETLATIGDFTVYTTSRDNYNTFANTFSDLFYVEEEQVYTINGESGVGSGVSSSNEEPWHLDRVSKQQLPLDGKFPYNASGSCHQNPDIEIHTYVIDTGIDVHHSEFEGRATWLANFVDSQDTDCNSHGTHCAGLVGSKSYGVCKDAKLFAVKVLDCRGSGSTSSVIRGIEYAFKRHLEQTKASSKQLRSIVSMSLGGGYSRALNTAVKATVKASGFYFSAAAGNEDQDACRTSPASVKEIFTVMASDKYDTRAYFSNYGNCADIYSPGVNILSTIPGDQTAVYSGTSMACPVLVGVLNHYVDQHPELNLAQLKKKVLEDANLDVLSQNPKATNNLLVYLNRV
jgi:cerevisin